MSMMDDDARVGPPAGYSGVPAGAVRPSQPGHGARGGGRAGQDGWAGLADGRQELAGGVACGGGDQPGRGSRRLGASVGQ